MSDQSLFEAVGGIEIFRRVNKVFYDKIYKHPWIGQYFKHMPQERIENQQTDFMVDAFGGPQNYNGRFVPDAHMHLHITEALWQLREKLLDESFVETGAPKAMIERWKKIDLAFKNKVVKASIADCKPRILDDPILSFPEPIDLEDDWKKAA